MATEPASKLGAPVDAASLSAFRIMFGVLMVVSTIRFAARGWIHDLYIAPSFHFTWAGFDWIQPWPGMGMYAHFLVMGLAALGVAVGFKTRTSAGIFAACFIYVELIDKAPYLNHYYLVSLLAVLLVVLPTDRVWSVDARLGKTAPEVGRWAVWLLRAQIGLVYVFAGIAKLNPDWLFEAQPMAQWLAMRAETPVVGPLLIEPPVAFAMSWAGALYDLTIPFWLIWRPTRRLAFASVVVFHVATWLLFPIGIFPWLMIASATIFFEPGWLRRGDIAPKQDTVAAQPLRAWAVAALVLWLGLQIALPLRHLAYPGQTLWTEQGFRFSWRVMLVEKVGMVEYEITAKDPEKRWTISIHKEDLTHLQRKMMSTQPDMILQYAHHLAARHKAQGHRGVEVRAHAFATFNGRPSARLIDPTVDLAAQPRGLSHAPWIQPLP